MRTTISVPCPICKAQPGKKCSGKCFHLERVLDAIEEDMNTDEAKKAYGQEEKHERSS